MGKGTYLGGGSIDHLGGGPQDNVPEVISRKNKKKKTDHSFSVFAKQSSAYLAKVICSELENANPPDLPAGSCNLLKDQVQRYDSPIEWARSRTEYTKRRLKMVRGNQKRLKKAAVKRTAE